MFYFNKYNLLYSLNYPCFIGLTLAQNVQKIKYVIKKVYFII